MTIERIRTILKQTDNYEIASIEYREETEWTKQKKQEQTY